MALVHSNSAATAFIHGWRARGSVLPAFQAAHCSFSSARRTSGGEKRLSLKVGQFFRLLLELFSSRPRHKPRVHVS